MSISNRNMRVFVFTLLAVAAALDTGCHVPETDSPIQKVVQGVDNIFGSLGSLVGIPRKKCIFFDVYTPTRKHDPVTIFQVEQLNTTTDYNPKNLNIFLAHAWLQNRKTDDIRKIPAAALQNKDVNFFIFDWSEYSTTTYSFARNNVMEPAARLADFINQLHANYNLNGSTTMLVGFGLGAHLVGNAGHRLVQKADRLVALDPSGPQYTLDPDDRLNPSNAKYVEVMHTDAGRLGMATAAGHADFYPNGGIAQNGCVNLLSLGTIGLNVNFLGICDHKRSIDYFVESLLGYTFEAVQCNDYEDFLKGRCEGNTRTTMGGLTRSETDRPKGSFYCRTGKVPPFSGIDPETAIESVDTIIKDYQRDKAAVERIKLNYLLQLVRYFVKDLGK